MASARVNALVLRQEDLFNQTARALGLKTKTPESLVPRASEVIQ
jgi:hypothetical protein